MQRGPDDAARRREIGWQRVFQRGGHEARAVLEFEFVQALDRHRLERRPVEAGGTGGQVSPDPCDEVAVEDVLERFGHDRTVTAKAPERKSVARAKRKRRASVRRRGARRDQTRDQAAGCSGVWRLAMN